MPTTQIQLERFSLISFHPFDSVVAWLEGAIGHPDVGKFTRDIAGAKTSAEVEALVDKAVGPSGLMEFARFDIGQVMRKDRPQSPRILRLVIGNPLIMKQMVAHVPDAASYAPVTILVDERRDGVHLSYDRMASLIAPYSSPQALKVARDLDAKIEALLTAAAG